MLRKGDHIADFQDGSVVQHGGSGKASEHLVAVIVHPKEPDFGFTVVDRDETQIKPSLAVTQMPGIHIVFSQNKIHLSELVGSSPVKEYIFAGNIGVSEAAAQVEAEHFTVQPSAAVTPVPLVVEGPHAPAPVQDAEGILWVKGPFMAVSADITLCGHAVDLVVVVKGVPVFIKGQIHHQGIRILPFQLDPGIQILPAAGQDAASAGGFKTHENIAVSVFVGKSPMQIGERMVGLGVCGHMEGAEGESQGAADIKIFFPLLKIKEHETDLARIDGVADGELETKMAVGDLVKIPLFDAPGESPDGSAVIG